MGVGSITGYKLAFHKKSLDGSGKADAYYTGNDAHCVWGVLFNIDVKEKPELDCAEGLSQGYDEKSIAVSTDRGHLNAVMYYATSIDEDLTPYYWYVDFVVRGARQHSLPDDYVTVIEGVPQKADPEESRDAMNRSIVC